MASSRELLCFGRPPNGQLGHSDEAIAKYVRERQNDAYRMLEDLEADMHTLIAQCLSVFSPAERQLCVSRLKERAAMHIWTEVVSIIKTYDGHVAAVLREVNLKVLVSTLDAANKLFANLLVGPTKAFLGTHAKSAWR